jgi:hypothetical protein
VDEKVCSVCQGTFPADQFSPKGRQCRACIRAKQRRWLKDNPGKDRHYRKCWEKRNPNFNEIYRDRCRARENTVRGRLASLLAKARVRSRRDGWACDIDLPWLADAYDQQGGRCAATGTPLVVRPVVPRGQPRDGHWNPHGPSLDRLDLHKGYTRDNVRITCVLWNMATNEWGEGPLSEAAVRFLRRQGWSLTPPPGVADIDDGGGPVQPPAGPPDSPPARPAAPKRRAKSTKAQPPAV